MRIVRNPQAWGGVEFGLRRYVLDQFPYAVIYRPTPSSIYVVAIIHLRRKPSYWHDRLRDLPDSP